MLTLIIGGAGSGKSALAERLACALDGARIYLATMEIYDHESRLRVERHRELRKDKGFQTVEQPVQLERAEIPVNANVLLEDLSNLLANEMFSPDGNGCESIPAGIEAIQTRASHLTIVTNEVFSGGVDHDAGTLKFLSNLAWLNREITAKADTVIEVVCGLPNVLKGELPWSC